MMVVDNKYEIGDFVYLKTDKDQSCRIVYGIDIRKDSITYWLGSGTQFSQHYDFELSKEKDAVLSII